MAQSDRSEDKPEEVSERDAQFDNLILNDWHEKTQAWVKREIRRLLGFGGDAKE